MVCSGLSAFLLQEKLFSRWYEKLSIDKACSVDTAGYWPRSLYLFVLLWATYQPMLKKETKRNETKRNCTDLVKNLGEYMFVQYWYILGTVWNHCWCQCVQYGQLPGNKAMLSKPPKQTMKLSYTRWEIKESESGTTPLIWGHLLYFETNVL